MKISMKLGLFLIGVLVLFVGLAGSLIRQAEAVSAGYDALLARPVQASDRARVMQVDFKKQVQEWKDILLRGSSPADLEKYTQNFHAQSAATDRDAAALLSELDDSQARQLVTEFTAAHATLNAVYEKAYQAYVSGGFDFKAADAMVRGQDRAPTDICDRIVGRLGAYVSESVATQQAAAAVARKTSLILAGVLLFILWAIGSIIVKSILIRLKTLKGVSDRLASGDIDGLSIDISGRDEIGDFGESMKGVVAAVEELMSMSGSGKDSQARA